MKLKTLIPIKRSWKRIVLLHFLILAGFDQSYGQNWKSFIFQQDTITNTKPDFSLYYDSRNSFLRHSEVNINSINAGIIFGKKRNELTLGYDWIKKGPEFYYLNLMYFPYLIYDKRWHIALPLEIGVGSSDTTQSSLINEIEVWHKSDWFVPAQLGFYTEFKATRYLGASFLLGYRQILFKKNTLENFNGLYYSLGLNFYPGVLWRDFKSRKRK